MKRRIENIVICSLMALVTLLLPGAGALAQPYTGPIGGWGTTFDASIPGYTLKMTGYIVLSAPTRGSTNAIIQTGATASYNGQALFSATLDKADNYCDYWLIVPPDLDITGIMKVAYAYFETDAAIGAGETVAWKLSVVGIGDNSLFNGTPANEVALTYTAGSAHHAHDAHVLANTTLTGWAAALTPGYLMQIRLARDGDDGALDTTAAGTYSGPIFISYSRTQ
jgi:hypothetical protein